MSSRGGNPASLFPFAISFLVTLAVPHRAATSYEEKGLKKFDCGGRQAPKGRQHGAAPLLGIAERTVFTVAELNAFSACQTPPPVDLDLLLIVIRALLSTD